VAEICPRDHPIRSRLIWTRAIVAGRLQDAFSERHRSIDAVRILDMDRRWNGCQKLPQPSAYEHLVDDEPMVAGAQGVRRYRMASKRLGSIDGQLCKGAVRIGAGRGSKYWPDPPSFWAACKEAQKIIAADDKVNRASKVKQKRIGEEREEAAAIAAARLDVKDHPSRFTAMLTDYVDLPQYDLLIYEGLAEEAWMWLQKPVNCERSLPIRRRLACNDLEDSRVIILDWLRSGLERRAFCYKSDLNLDRFNERFDDICAEIAAAFNHSGVPVPERDRHPLFGPQVLIGVKAIASYLGRSFDGTLDLIDEGKLPVALHGGVIVANADFITFARKHRTRPERARSQV
jgi:hypothetical protein